MILECPWTAVILESWGKLTAQEKMIPCLQELGADRAHVTQE
jgi:hypothetical protein